MDSFAALDLAVDPAAVGDEIARTDAGVDAATQRLLTSIRAFDEAEEWGRQGAPSFADWQRRSVS